MGDNKNEIEVRIGEMQVAKAPVILKSLLGSCVAVILYDKINRVGGLAHIFLPKKSMNPKNEVHPDSRYADTAVPRLLSEVLQIGAEKRNLVAYMVGGNKVLTVKKASSGPTVAEQNIIASQEAIAKENLFMINLGVSKDTGSKVKINLSTGDIEVLEIKKYDQIET